MRSEPNLVDVLGSLRIKSIQAVGPEEEFEGKHIRGKVFPTGKIHIMANTKTALGTMSTLVEGLAKQIGLEPEFVAEVDSWFINAKNADSADIDALFEALDTMIEAEL